MTDISSIVPPFRISSPCSQQELSAVRDLFGFYAASLPVDLDYQDFESELASLPGKYAHPDGELLVARDALNRYVGCVALRSLEAGCRCEMKRLYVIPMARSFGLGRMLTEAIIAAAKSRGYSEMLLDTLPTMGAAAGLYERMGFQRIEAYYGPTPCGTIFMSLDLTRL